jgi:uncharacterized membrane protein
MGRLRDDVTGDAATVNARRAIKVERSVTVGRPARELYDLWRNFENLPRWLAHLESVRIVDGRTHWVATGPASGRIEWDSELVNDIPGELIAWKTVGNPDVAHAGSVHFTPTANGDTEVRFVVDYEPPGGGVTSAEPVFAGIGEDLDQFKAQAEAT